MDGLRETYNQIGKASLIIIIVSLIDKILAIAKEMIIAQQFGISASLDVFNIAYALPCVIGLLSTGALVSAFVPLYLQWNRQFSSKRADAYALSLLSITAVLFGLLTVVCYLLSPIIFPLMGYGFGIEEKRLGIILEKLLVYLVFMDGVSTILMALLQSQKKFMSLQIAPVFINISIILLLIVRSGLGIYALVWGFLLGTFCKMIYMILVLYRGGFNFISKPDFDRSILISFVSLAIPLLANELTGNANLLVDVFMATQLSQGAVSTLRYAYRLNALPVQIIILAIPKAILPFISEQALNKDYEGLQAVFKHSIIFPGFITFPIMCITALFSQDIVELVLKRGAFDAYASQQTAQTLLCYCFGLFFYAYIFVNGAFFTALKDAKPLFLIGSLSIVLNIIFNIIFMRFWEVKGIALSTTFTLGITSLIFLFMIKWRLGFSNFAVIFANFYRIIIASVAIFLGGFVFKHWLVNMGIHRLIYFPLISAVMVLCYIVSIWLLRTRELENYLKMLGRMIRLNGGQYAGK